jgi:hypothetical protein
LKNAEWSCGLWLMLGLAFVAGGLAVLIIQRLT